MADNAILTPVPGDDPCGTDLQWDADFMAFADAFSRILGEDHTNVVEGERVGEKLPSLDDVVADARRLSARTKDMRVLAVYLEAMWQDAGLPAFAEALVDIVTVAETWADPGTGLHPRADPDDGDLSERIAPLAKLLRRIPEIGATVGWGMQASQEQQDEARERLRSVFGDWTARLEPAFGPDLPSPREAWEALRKIVGEVERPEGESEDEGRDVDTATRRTPSMDAWDAIERAMTLMVEQNRHSPAVPVLRLLLGWRELDLVEISQRMRTAGISLEQLLDSIKSQLDAGH